MRRVARIAGTLFVGLGLLLLVWAFVVCKWGDPVTSVYTRWEQRKLESRYEKLSAAFPSAVPPSAVLPARPRGTKEDARARARVRAAADRYRLAAETGQPVGRIKVPRLGLSGRRRGTDHESSKGPGWFGFMPGEVSGLHRGPPHRTAPRSRIDRLVRGDVVVIGFHAAASATRDSR
jgi:hypothetical protein